MSAIAAGSVNTTWIVRHRQQLGLALGEPCLCRCALALRAMPVAAGVVGDRRVRAVLAALDMAAERRRAAALDGRHDLQLAEAHVAGVGLPPSRAVVAEDIRDLQRRARHAAARQAGGSFFLGLQVRRSSGLITSRIVLVATRV